MSGSALLVQAGLLLVAPPFVLGLVGRTKSWLAGRTGAPLWQPWAEVLKLLRKGVVMGAPTTWIFRAGPLVALAAVLAAGLIVPLAAGAGPLGFDGDVVAFAATGQYRPRECYAGVAECSVYVARPYRGRGAGGLALDALISAAGAAGFWKLLSRIFVENAASRSLVARAGFREVGVYERHGQLDGVWRDVVIVERLLR